MSYLALLASTTRRLAPRLAARAERRRRCAPPRRARRLGDRWHTALLLGLLAEAALAAGDVTGGAPPSTRRSPTSPRPSERYYEAELCRLRAECALAGGGPTATTEARLARARRRARGGKAPHSGKRAR